MPSMISELGGTPETATVEIGTFSLTSRNSSLAVLPMIALMGPESVTPGSCSRMRSSPWRTMVGSLVPDSSTRRRRISIDCSRICVLRAVSAASVKTMRKLPSGVELTSSPSSRRRTTSSALGRSASSRTLPTTASPSTSTSRKRTCSLRNSPRMVSERLASRSCMTGPMPTSSRKCAPPRRSSPSPIWRDGTKSGHSASCSLAKKLGMQRMSPSKQVPMIRTAFQVGMCIMVRSAPCWRWKDGSSAATSSHDVEAARRRPRAARFSSSSGRTGRRNRRRA